MGVTPQGTDTSNDNAQFAKSLIKSMKKKYPGTAQELCALKTRSPFELLVATILSAQCTDERVNMVTPELFEKYPTPKALAGADPGELEEVIRSTGFYHAKSKHLLGMARDIFLRFDSVVPSSLEDLVTLPGVGRKTANVVRSVAFDLPGLPVDTHVARVAKRLGLTRSDDPVRIEKELGKLIPEKEQGVFSIRLILHGRALCQARKPKCTSCFLAGECPSSSTN